MVHNVQTHRSLFPSEEPGPNQAYCPIYSRPVSQNRRFSFLGVSEVQTKMKGCGFLKYYSTGLALAGVLRIP